MKTNKNKTNKNNTIYFRQRYALNCKLLDFTEQHYATPVYNRFSYKQYSSTIVLIPSLCIQPKRSLLLNNVDFWDEGVSQMPSGIRADDSEKKCEWVTVLVSSDVRHTMCTGNVSRSEWHFLLDRYSQGKAGNRIIQPQWILSADDVSTTRWLFFVVVFLYFHVKKPEYRKPTHAQSWPTQLPAVQSPICGLTTKNGQFLANLSDSSTKLHYSDVNLWIQFTGTV